MIIRLVDTHKYSRFLVMLDSDPLAVGLGAHPYPWFFTERR
jgi:hypothetical protein